MKSLLKKYVLPLVIIAIAIAVFVFMKTTKPQQAKVEFSEKAWMVEAVNVEEKAVASVHRLYGTIESSALVAFASPISAQVEGVMVKPGDQVKNGQSLINLHQGDIDVLKMQAQASVQEAESLLGLQKIANKINQKKLEQEQRVLALKKEQLERTKSLIKRQLASDSALDNAKESFYKQESAVTSLQQKVDEAQLNLEKMEAALNKALAQLKQITLDIERARLVAPFDGRVADVNVSQGDRVSPSTVMLRLYALDSMELKVKLPVKLLDEVQQGLVQGHEFKAFFTTQGHQHELRLLRLAGQADTRGVDAYFEIPESLFFKRPGELMEIELQGVLHQNVYELPYSALYGSDRVYKIVEGRLQSQNITVVGETNVDGQLMAIVTGNLSNDDQVLLTHLPNAISGLKVEVQQ